MSESITRGERRTLRIAVAGGGSGGHVSPAVAVIEQLRTMVDLSAVWVGARPEYEGAAAQRLGIEFHCIRAGKLRRYLSASTIVDAFKIPIGVVQARSALRGFRPDAVLSTGGFVSVPTVIAAWMLGIPTMTHEQTAHIGLATTINARFCSVVALSFERSRGKLGRQSAKAIVTGNPVRSLALGGDSARAFERFGFVEDLPLVYVTGGAQGSRALNALVLEALDALLERANVLHQCGPRTEHDDFDRLTAKAESLPEALRARYRVVERVGDELGDIYAAATLVVGRAGAGTVAELAATGLPSVLIPLPGATEQRHNALQLVESGGAVMLEQTGLTADVLARKVLALLDDVNALRRMRQGASSVYVPGAAERIAAALISLVDSRSGA